MKKLVILLIILVILLSGCETEIITSSDLPFESVTLDMTKVNEISHAEYTFTVYPIHDDINNLTCWITLGIYKGSIFCIPDWQLVAPNN